MELRIIVAIAANGAIGRNGDLLFHISADLRRFKQLTIGHPIIMGRKTFESFPKGPLPGRLNIVVTRNESYSHPGIETAHSLNDAIAIATSSGAEAAYVIGGGEIYRQALELADRIDLTEIDANVADADTFFPLPGSNNWTVEAIDHPAEPTIPPIRFITLRAVRH